MRIKVGDLRHIEGLYLGGEISYSRQVEMLNDIANQPDTHYVESIMPTEEEILKEAKKCNHALTSLDEGIWMPKGFREGANWVVSQIKSRLAGKEEQK